MNLARPFLAAGLIGLAAAGTVPASAQQIFRIVGPDGRVTFSDKPPAEGNARTAPVVPMTGAASTSALPFELRGVTQRYPVTLYTGANCGPCGSGRTYLSSRGIPFTEKTVSSNEDIEALQRLSGGSSLPFLTIGGQQMRGYSEVEWGQFLDAAGYPKTSQLPSGWRNPNPTPLVAVQARPAEAPRAEAAPPAPSAPSAPSGPGPSNPAGITF